MRPQLLPTNTFSPSSSSSSFVAAATFLPNVSPLPSPLFQLYIYAARTARTEKRLKSSEFRTKRTATTITQPKQDKTGSTKNKYTRPSLHSIRQPPSLQAAFCNALDDLINNFIDPPLLHPSVDPRHILSANFAPVTELPPTPCPVVLGSIPPCLGGGAYIRNGPNPQYLPRGPHHLFDGDGMLHSLLLPAGGGTSSAILCSRHVHTYKYLLERDTGAPVLPNVFSGFHGTAGIARGAVAAVRVITGQMNPLEGVGLANTSLAFFGGRLYALGESDLPYAVNLSPGSGDIATLGRHDFEGRVAMSMTAHPKRDPVTGEVFAFRYGPIPPYVTYFRFDRNGTKAGPDVPIFSMRDPCFLHDFAITENYTVFPDIQMVMKPMDMVLGRGFPVGSDHAKVPRIGILPRYAATEAGMRWFEVPGFNIMHALNAWEEDGGNTIVLVAPNVLSIEHALERMELVHNSVEMVRIDLRSGAVSRKPLSAGNLEFGVINSGYVGRRNRYAYLGVGDPMPKIAGVVKLDFEKAGHGDCVVAQREFGPGCFGGEPFFVHGGEGGEEDEGYVVSYVHDEGSGESRFIVMDAQSPELEIVAEVRLPRRVPYGFHGLFVSQEELRSQRPL